MRAVVVGSFFSCFAILAAFAACTTNNTNDAVPDGGTPVVTPTGDGGTVPTNTDTDGGTCNKAPPTGAVTLIAPAPAGSTNNYGKDSVIALDKNGYPMVAFATDGDAGQVFFMSWDPCAGAWKAPSVVDTAGGGQQGGEVNDNTPLREVQIAYDNATGAIAIVYQKQIPDASNAISAVWIAKSTDGGATWKTEQLSVHPTDEAGDIHSAESPNVAFAGGKIWVTYGQSYTWCNGSFKDPADGTKRCEGWVLNGDSGSWSRQIFQRGSDGAVAGFPAALAVDSAGVLGIAFLTDPDTAYNRVVSFWRPSTTVAPVTVFDSNNEQNDSPVVSLVFDGVKPRIAAQMVRDASANYNGLFSKSDDGVTWTPFTTIPVDPTRNTVWYQAMTVDSKGTLSVAAYDNGGNDQTPVCGDPQVMRSTDGVTWTPFCVEKTMTDGIEGGAYIAAKMGTDDKMQLVFFNNSTVGSQPGAGVMYWHE